MPDTLILKLLAFYHLNPAAALFFLACGMTIFRKVMKHISKSERSAYSLRDLRKYPSEAIELLLILAALGGSVWFFVKG